MFITHLSQIYILLNAFVMFLETYFKKTVVVWV